MFLGLMFEKLILVLVRVKIGRIVKLIVEFSLCLSWIIGELSGFVGLCMGIKVVNRMFVSVVCILDFSSVIYSIMLIMIYLGRLIMCWWFINYRIVKYVVVIMSVIFVMLLV